MRRPYYIAAGFLPHLSLSALQARSGRYVIFPYYHTVSDRPLAHIHPLYRHRTVDEFKRDLDYLQQHMTAIRWTDVEAFESQCHPAFCMTFDDGLVEFYEIVAPILRERNIPCVNFLNSDFVGNRDVFYRYKAALIVSALRDTARETKQMRERLLSVPYSQRDVLDKIAQKYHADINGYLLDHPIYMNYEQIRELQGHGFTFGNHSASHPHYSTLTEDEQLAQTEQSAAELGKHIALERLFSFPFGQGDLSQSSIDRLCATHDAVFGTDNLRKGQPGLYNRIWMEGYDYSAEKIIKGEYIRFLLNR